MSSVHFEAPDFVGPPTAKQMERVVTGLLIENKPSQAERLADVMVDFWQHATKDHCTSEYERQFQFSYWLGIRTAAGMVDIGRENRSRDRRNRRRS